LGYGIENNAITPRLPAIYQKVLKEELQRGWVGERGREVRSNH
jgi:muramidase (phage lysozyme)